MELRVLRYFLLAAREENMTRAFDINVRIRDVQVAGRGHTCVFPVLNG